MKMPQPRGFPSLEALDTLYVPPPVPLAMPTQDLSCFSDKAGHTRPPSSKRVFFARFFVFAFSFIWTVWGTYQIYKVISVNGITGLQVLFATVFALTFAWIAFSCASGLLGFWRLLVRRFRHKPPPPPDITTKTALLMPVYAEDPAHTFGTLERMASSLVGEGLGDRFDFFILSDTRDLDVVREEVRFYGCVRERFGEKISFFYRRRPVNIQRKAGNIADWVTRWGGGYDHMIILDADSFMQTSTLQTLVRVMQADPIAGIIQSVPVLHKRDTLFGRLQQFCGRVYGPIIAEGLAAWYGREGNYWGHNAIIRVSAFAESCGLPELPGKKPFGGDILSHDFVEAALMVRAGWSVSMRPELLGSYEESPPTILELAVRDRRWAQGNLQHIKVVGARGLHWISRVHLIQGIFSYLASPLWFALLLVGLALSLQAQFSAPNYFPDGFSLFPSWPVFDPERALNVFYVTMGILFLPKVLGLFIALLDDEMRRTCGGYWGLLASFILETLLSALLAPIFMISQTHVICDILLGRDSGWSPQHRQDRGISWLEALRSCGRQMVFGVAMGVAAFLVSWEMVLWTLPITAGLILSPVLVKATSSTRMGILARRLFLLRIPEEDTRPRKDRS